MINVTPSMLPPGGRPDTIPINASGLKVSACYRRWVLEIVWGLKPEEEASILTTGKIIHKFAEDIANDRSEERIATAMLFAIKDAAMKKLPAAEQGYVKSAVSACPVDRLAKPILIAGQSGAEFKFNFPIETAPGFAYVGTIDRVLHDTRQNILIIEDIKTSRKWVFNEIIKGYKGDPQFTFYPWIMHKFAYSIFSDNLALGNLAWYRNLAMRVLAVMLSAKPVVWREGPLETYTAERFETFGHAVQDFIEDVKPYVDQTKLPPPTGIIMNACPSCPFQPLCFAQNNSHFEVALQSFKVVKYEPLKW